MTFKNLFIEHNRSPEEEAWLEEEITEQQERFLKIEKERSSKNEYDKSKSYYRTFQ